jgi:hypothetical protein
MKLFRSFALSLCILLGCGAAQEIAAIVNSNAPKPTPQEWQPTILITKGPTICSGTVVGPRIAITSARCLAESTSTPVFAKVGGQIQALELCISHPHADVALCVSTEYFFNQRIAVLGIGGKGLDLGVDVELVGYGCRLPEGVDRNFGNLTVGTAQVTRFSTREATVVGSALCSGDNGGGAYVWIEGVKDPELVGVLSRGDMRQSTVISQITNPEIADWAIFWSRIRGGICRSDDRSACDESGTGRLSPQSIPPMPWIEKFNTFLTSSDPASSSLEETLSIGWLGIEDQVLASAASDQAMFHDSFIFPSRLAAGRRLDFQPEATITTADGIPLQHLTKLEILQGETLETATNRICGKVSANYIAALKSLPEQHHLSRTIPLPSNTEISFLPCPLADTYQLRRIEANAKAQLLSYFGALPNNSIWLGFEAPPGASSNYRHQFFLDATRAFNLDADLEFKNTTESVFIQIPESPPTSPSNSEFDPNSQEVEAILTAQGAISKCKAPQSYEAYPIDASALLDVLARNREKRPRSSGGPKEATIVTPDTGIFGANIGIFRNGGVGVEEGFGLADIRPHADSQEPMHGTEVATLLLGGPLLAGIQASGPRHIRLLTKLIFKRTVNEGETYFGTDTTVFGQISELLEDKMIVNLSLMSSYLDPSLKAQAWSSNGRAFFVVSAGNQNKQLGDAGVKIYPASLGGEHAPGFLVVGALDGDGQRAPFSNYSPDFVEIAAPGCSVPSLAAVFDEYSNVVSFGPVRVNGTSVAAPLVAFAAALIESERGTPVKKPKGPWPASIKRRLLVSADLQPDLKDFVTDGRTLNVVKAASIFHDVLELKNPSRIVFGDVRFSIDGTPQDIHKPIVMVCNDKPHEFEPTSILKIVPDFANDERGPVAKVYTLPSDGDQLPFRNWTCTLPDDLGFYFTDADFRTPRVFTTSEVADFVRRLDQGEAP